MECVVRATSAEVTLGWDQLESSLFKGVTQGLSTLVSPLQADVIC